MDHVRARRALLRWFARAKRPLPWRQTKDPYAIWVSETMLQQTTVGAVIPFFKRFMERFPTVASLAASSEDAVLSEWSGLGYYSRARNLQRAASRLVEEHHSAFPRDVATAMSLEGVGRYTASAVTSMAYGTRAAVVDGNVRRVISRLHGKRFLAEGRVQKLADQLLSRRSPGHWNEAMMELGATVCSPKMPQCPKCPLSADCRGQSRAEYWSQGKPRAKSIHTPVEMALVERAGRILFVRNHPGDLMSGLLELPHAGLPRARAPVQTMTLKERYPEVLSIERVAIATIRHAVTHHRVEASVFRAKLLGRTPGGTGIFYKLSELERLPLGGLTRKALRALGILAR